MAQTFEQYDGVYNKRYTLSDGTRPKVSAISHYTDALTRIADLGSTPIPSTHELNTEFRNISVMEALVIGSRRMRPSQYESLRVKRDVAALALEQFGPRMHYRALHRLTGHYDVMTVAAEYDFEIRRYDPVEGLRQGLARLKRNEDGAYDQVCDAVAEGMTSCYEAARRPEIGQAAISPCIEMSQQLQSYVRGLSESEADTYTRRRFEGMEDLLQAVPIAAGS
jgi:hypothetical protein